MAKEDVGASLTGVGTGYLIEKFGWSAGFYFLTADFIKGKGAD